MFQVNQWINPYKECIQKLPKAKTLFVSNYPEEVGFENTFIVSRDEEKYKLIQNISESSSRFVVIDSKNNIDKDSIVNLLKNSKKEIVILRHIIMRYLVKICSLKFCWLTEVRKGIRKLSRRISEKVSGTSRSREDIDTFFLSLGLKEARNLKPAIDYISEKDFDIFILNSWNTNDKYQPLEKDLIGSIHSDMPIMMPIPMPKYIAEENRTREFAIGYDAFEIILLRYGSVNSKKTLSTKVLLEK